MQFANSEFEMIKLPTFIKILKLEIEHKHILFQDTK